MVLFEIISINNQEDYMKTTILFFVTLFAGSCISFSKTYTIINSGFTFSPSTISVNVGDTVDFVLADIHNAREVDKSTWDVDGNTSNGGFDTPDGGGMVVLNQAGTVYYVCKYHASMGMKGTITVNAATGINQVSNSLPQNYSLMQNYPNPFNPTTRISYALPYESKITLSIYDLTGRLVSKLVNNTESAGYHSVNFNASNLASGIYFYRIEAVSADGSKKFKDTKKLVLLK